jgi:hypothetical protein
MRSRWGSNRNRVGRARVTSRTEASDSRQNWQSADFLLSRLEIVLEQRPEVRVLNLELGPTFWDPGGSATKAADLLPILGRLASFAARQRVTVIVRRARGLAPVFTITDNGAVLEPGAVPPGTLAQEALWSRPREEERTTKGPPPPADQPARKPVGRPNTKARLVRQFLLDALDKEDHQVGTILCRECRQEIDVSEDTFWRAANELALEGALTKDGGKGTGRPTVLHRVPQTAAAPQNSGVS